MPRRIIHIRDQYIMKILLISANTVNDPYPVYPLGLDYVAGAVSAHHEVKIIDMNLISGYEELGSAVKEYSPDITGISLRNIDNTSPVDTESYISHYGEVIRRVRENSSSPVVLGGSGFTIFPGELMEALDADYGIAGEGERFALLLEAIEKDSDASGLPGVFIKNKGKEIPPPWGNSFKRVFDSEYQHTGYYLKKGGMLNLQSKRGCNFRCIYCTYPHIEGRKPRLIDPEEVASDAVKLQQAGAKYLFITDSVFNSDTEHSMSVARAFIRAGVSIPWGAFFAPVRPPDDYFPLMAEAGLTHAEFGTESLCDRILKIYRKPFNTDDVYYAHEKAKASVHVAHYMLLGGPGEDRDSLSETLANAGRLSKTVIFFFCGIRIYPGTELFDIAVREKQIDESGSFLMPVFYQSSLISSADIVKTVEEKALGRVNWIIGAGGEKIARALAKMYRRGHTGPLWEYLIQ